MDTMNELRARAALLEIKACDLRDDALLQCATSVDKGIHIGGAYSAIPPMTALYYGGYMQLDLQQPTSLDQDMFVLSKGHAVAALASVYADIGYFGRDKLTGTRGYGAMIKGHPGPCIPGVAVATGPLGHGISLAAGFALRRSETGRHHVYTLVGDGELQEGSCWEGIQFAADRRLRNLCVMVDANHGQSDNTTQLFISMESIGRQLESFGYRVFHASSDDMLSLLTALERFEHEPNPMSQPTAIICHGYKGMGGYAALTGKHKTTMEENQLAQERQLLQAHRQQLVTCLRAEGSVAALATEVGYALSVGKDGKPTECKRCFAPVRVKHAAPRDKSIQYNEAALPVLSNEVKYSAFELLSKLMSLFATDERLYTVDSDLSNASGLYDGTRATNRMHAVNVGIAECNMMCIAEALAAEGANVWCSTFTPFFNWQALRRIAVSWQERQEVIESKGWLSDGHNLDITFVGTAANLDTAVNGATHMGNDDICVYDQIAHLKIIDISCPRQLVAIAKWIAEGNRGLVYLRTMRNASRPLYPEGFRFEYGKGYRLRQPEAAPLYIVTSGHAVVEALDAADALAQRGISIGVLDMPSFDGEQLAELLKKGTRLLFAEQNNGAIFDRFARFALQRRLSVDASLVRATNTLDSGLKRQFIPSGTYAELSSALALNAAAMEQQITHWLKEENLILQEEQTDENS